MPEVQMANAPADSPNTNSNSENVKLKNYSPAHENYIRERVKQSPLGLSGNKFFVENELNKNGDK